MGNSLSYKHTITPIIKFPQSVRLTNFVIKKSNYSNSLNKTFSVFNLAICALVIQHDRYKVPLVIFLLRSTLDSDLPLDFFVTNPLASNRFSTALDLIPKLVFSGTTPYFLRTALRLSFETATATTLPNSSTIGPPLLPGCNAASI